MTSGRSEDLVLDFIFVRPLPILAQVLCVFCLTGRNLIEYPLQASGAVVPGVIGVEMCCVYRETIVIPAKGDDVAERCLSALYQLLRVMVRFYIIGLIVFLYPCGSC